MTRPPVTTTTPDLRANALILTIVPFAVYIQGTPAPGTARTLSWLLNRSDEWGWFLVACGLVALVCSLRASWVRGGHQVIMFGAGVWAVCLAVGFIDGRASWGGVGSVCFYSLLAFTSARSLNRT